MGDHPTAGDMTDATMKAAAYDLYDALYRLLNDPSPNRQYVMGHPAARAALRALSRARGEA